MANYRDESPDKCVHFVVFDKKILGSLILLWCDKDIFTILSKKWSTEPFAEYEVIE